MPEQILADWTAEQAALMERGTLLARHRLQDSEMFSDAGLIRILDRHPREDLHVYTMGSDLRAQEWRMGESGGLSGERLLEAATRGHLWYNLLRMSRHHADYAELVAQIYGELESTCPGFRSFNRSANLLISSPSALVFYHADAPLNILWHIRGRKRCWVYPFDDPRFVSQENRERVFAPGEEGEELPYDESFDAAAQIFDLEPGQILTWPQNTPHRIENLEGLNVSLSTEHYTAEARRRQAVFLANHSFRQLLPFGFRSSELYGIGPALKANAFRVARRLGLVARHENNLPISFAVDLEAPDCVRWTDESQAPKDRASRAA